jgi:hypothetical protein
MADNGMVCIFIGLHCYRHQDDGSEDTLANYDLSVCVVTRLGVLEVIKRLIHYKCHRWVMSMGKCVASTITVNRYAGTRDTVRT